MANNKNTKAKKTASKKVAAKKVIPNKEDEVVEDETVEETEEEETTEEGEDTTEESEEGEEGDDTEEEDEDEEESEEEFSDASAKTDKVAIYRGEVVVRIFNSVNHGPDYKKIAKAQMAKMIEKDPSLLLEVKDFFEPQPEKPDPDTVRVYNASRDLVREFSLAVHGKDYKNIASAFMDKHGVKRGYFLE